MIEADGTSPESLERALADAVAHLPLGPDPMGRVVVTTLGAKYGDWAGPRITEFFVRVAVVATARPVSSQSRSDRGNQMSEQQDSGWEVVGLDGTTTRTTIFAIWQTRPRSLPPQYLGELTRGTLALSMNSDMSSPVQIIDVGPSYSDRRVVMLEGLNPGTAYYFRVSAENLFGHIKDSMIVHKTTKA